MLNENKIDRPNAHDYAAAGKTSAGSIDCSIAWASRPFTRWHLRRKYEVMEELFRRFVPERARFVDMGCGSGEALMLAHAVAPEAELWGMDMDRPAVETAQSRVPSAKIVYGDITKSGNLPENYFDVVHEFGAAFLCKNWEELARIYFSLLKPGGLLFWELPQKWSSAHISYMLRVAPERYPGESKLRRIARSALPSKYRFESDAKIRSILDGAGCPYEVIARVPLWHFFARGFSSRLLDLGWKFAGDGLFDRVNSMNAKLWPRYSGYYLVVRKSAGQSGEPRLAPSRPVH